MWGIRERRRRVLTSLCETIQFIYTMVRTMRRGGMAFSRVHDVKLLTTGRAMPYAIAMRYTRTEFHLYLPSYPMRLSTKIQILFTPAFI